MCTFTSICSRIKSNAKITEISAPMNDTWPVPFQPIHSKHQSVMFADDVGKSYQISDDCQRLEQWKKYNFTDVDRSNMSWFAEHSNDIQVCLSYQKKQIMIFKNRERLNTNLRKVGTPLGAHWTPYDRFFGYKEGFIYYISVNKELCSFNLGSVEKMNLPNEGPLLQDTLIDSNVADFSILPDRKPIWYVKVDRSVYKAGRLLFKAPNLIEKAIHVGILKLDNAILLAYTAPTGPNEKTSIIEMFTDRGKLLDSTFVSDEQGLQSYANNNNDLHKFVRFYHLKLQLVAVMRIKAGLDLHAVYRGKLHALLRNQFTSKDKNFHTGLAVHRFKGRDKVLISGYRFFSRLDL